MPVKKNTKSNNKTLNVVNQIDDNNQLETINLVDESTEPQVTEPQVTEPQVTESSVTEPQVTEPQVTEPSVTEPQVTEPSVTEPSVVTKKTKKSSNKKVKKDINLDSDKPDDNTTIKTDEEKSVKSVKRVKSKVINKKLNVKKTKDVTKTDKKTKKTKLEKSTTESKDDIVPDEEEDLKARSFKVKLPDDTDYKGRFTGLTPYQAANKALSKYFRNQENVNITDNNQILFSIKESTRGTHKKIYNYQGCRIKLETAISYTIKSADGTERIITKQYKNQLIKIKKNATQISTSEPAIALA